VSPPRPVLIVEDDADLREMMAQLLTLEGYKIETVANGREALEYLNEAPRPDVILLDLMMPIMDGWAFCRSRWKSRTLREIPVVLISAVDMSESNRPTGIDAFLPKPIDVDQFARLAARMAGRRRARPRPGGLLH
jgi:CheY-like chemotaxis protein